MCFGQNVGGGAIHEMARILSRFDQELKEPGLTTTLDCWADAKIVQDPLPGTSGEITFKEGYPSMPETEGNRDLLHALNDVNRALGVSNMEPYDPGHRGAGDLSFVAPYVASISGLGSYGNGAHAPSESVNLARQVEQARRVAIYLYRLTSSSPC